MREICIKTQKQLYDSVPDGPANLGALYQPDDLRLVYRLAREELGDIHRRQANVVEAGVHLGGSLRMLAWAFLDAGVDGHVFGVDPWRDTIGQTPPEDRLRICLQGIKTLGLRDVIVLLRLDSAVAASLWRTSCLGTIDVLHLDGDHSREAITEELEAWGRHLRPNARVIGHDWHLEPRMDRVVGAVVGALDGGLLRDLSVSASGRVWYARWAHAT